MTFDRMDTFYAVVDRRTKQFMFVGPLGLISIFSTLKEAHRIATLSHGIVVRCKSLELYEDAIGLNGKRLKRV